MCRRKWRDVCVRRCPTSITLSFYIVRVPPCSFLLPLKKTFRMWERLLALFLASTLPGYLPAGQLACVRGQKICSRSFSSLSSLGLSSSGSRFTPQQFAASILSPILTAATSCTHRPAGKTTWSSWLPYCTTGLPYCTAYVALISYSFKSSKLINK